MGEMSTVIVGIGLFCIYFMPSLIAQNRGHVNVNPITVINLFFGWTVIIWVICLAWSLSGKENR